MNGFSLQCAVHIISPAGVIILGKKIKKVSTNYLFLFKMIMLLGLSVPCYNAQVVIKHHQHIRTMLNQHFSKSILFFQCKTKFVFFRYIQADVQYMLHFIIAVAIKYGSESMEPPVFTILVPHAVLKLCNLLFFRLFRQ